MVYQSVAAGVVSERLDIIRNHDTGKKARINMPNFLNNNNSTTDATTTTTTNTNNNNNNTDNMYEILHNYGDANNENNSSNNYSGSNSKSRKDKNKELCHRYNYNTMQYAGLASVIKNSESARCKRIKADIHNKGDIMKSVIQYNKNEKNKLNNYDCYFSDKGYAVTPKRILARHVNDDEIDKYFYTKYDVTDKSSGRTEIMVARKSGCSNVIVQNFSEFDAYATYKRKDRRKNRSESVVHTKMGIMAKHDPLESNRTSKAQSVYTVANRSDNIAPENYWLCPIADSERVKKHQIYK